MRKLFFISCPLTAICFLILTITVSNNAVAQDKPGKSSAMQSGYAPVNGLKMYYEVHGNGKPLVLIHGSFMTINTGFGAIIPELSKNRKVIAMELQGHGRTADIDRPFSFESMADDISQLLKYLKIDSADIFGYSLGGGIALQVAIRHPEQVHKLVIVSSAFKFEGWYPEARALFPTLNPQMFEGSPIKKEYDGIAPDPKHWSDLVNKLKKLLANPYDFTAEKIIAIKKPALIIIGDSDGVQPEHAVEMFRLFGGGKMGDLAGLPNSQLAIFPATTHIGAMMHTDWLLAMMPAFLDAAVK